MDHIRNSGTEPSSVMLSQSSLKYENIKRDFFLDVYTILNRI